MFARRTFLAVKCRNQPAGGPAIEVSVTPPGGTASTDDTPESVTSSGVTYDRYVVTLGDAMDFDPEIAVRLVWNGVEVRNLPTRVRYVSREEGGVSHFRIGRDNALISWMHTQIGRAHV